MAYKPVESREEYLKILERYKDYQRDTYKSMTLEEKIDFFDGIHTDHVAMFDENGFDLWTLWDYGEITKEFIQHPEMFSAEHISLFLEMLDDHCYQPSFMEDTLKVICSIIRFHGAEAAAYLLRHLKDVPERAAEYGLRDSLCYLLADDRAHPILKEAVGLVDPQTRDLVRRILRDNILPACTGIILERAQELETLIPG